MKYILIKTQGRSNMRNLLKAIGLVQDWKYLTSLEFPKEITVTNRYGATQDGKLYASCYESNRGNRRIEYATTTTNGSNTDVSLVEYAESTEFYITTILPWLKGRRSVYIPGYNETDLDDFANAIKK